MIPFLLHKQLAFWKRLKNRIVLKTEKFWFSQENEIARNMSVLSVFHTKHIIVLNMIDIRFLKNLHSVSRKYWFFKTSMMAVEGG